jgi:hypothetical protein
MPPEPSAVVTDTDPLEGEELIAELSAETADALDRYLEKRAPEAKPAAAAPAPKAPEAKPAEEAAPAVEPKDGDLPDLDLSEIANPAGETKPAEEAAPRKDEEEKLPANLKDPVQIANWKTLRSEVKTAKAEAAAALKQVEEWKAKAETKADPEEVVKLKEANDRLTDQLAHFALEKSPAFVAQFDTPIATAEKTVYDSLKAAGANEEQLTKLQSLNGIHTQGLPYWDNVVAQLKANKDTEVQGLKIEVAIRDARRLAAEKQEALKDPEKRKAFQSKNFEAWKKRQEDDEAFLQGFIAEIQAKNEWARLKEVPATATPAEKAAIEAHNKTFNTYQDIFTKAVTSDDVAVRAKIGLAAVSAYRLQDRVKSLTAQLADKEERLAAIANAGKTTKPSVAPGRKVPGTTGVPEEIPVGGFGSSRDDLEAIFDKHTKGK